MAETRYDPLNVEAARQGLEFDQAPARKPEVHTFRFVPKHNDPDEIGLTKGVADLHGRALVNVDTVTPSHPLAVRVVRAGDLLYLTEDEDSMLLDYIRGHRWFRRAYHHELKD